MTTKEQELVALIRSHTDFGCTVEDILTKARECYAEVLSNQIHMYNEAVADANRFKDKCDRKDAALKSALEWLDEDEAPQLQRQIKEALK